LKYEDVPDPTPGSGQVLIKVHAIGVNPVETYIRSGSNAALPRPYTPGSDAVGVVESVGDGLKNWKSGDRVYTSATLTGAYAEKTLADVKTVYRLPDNVSFVQGAGINVPYATAYCSLFQRAHGVPGETVLVHGASGGVGTAAVQIARSHGFTVFGTAGTAEGLKLVQEQGALAVFNHREEGYLDKAKAATPNGAGFDIILEMLANVNLGKDLPMLAPKGRVVVIGSRGAVEINARDTMARDASIIGMLLFNAAPDELKTIHSALYAGLENGTLRPIVGQELPLSKAAKAHVEVMKSSGAFGKIVMTP
jgi:NADPH:quinone reductase